MTDPFEPDPFQTGVFGTGHLADRRWIVKVPRNSEVDIITMLQDDLASPNHTIPTEVIVSDNVPPILLMPILSNNLYERVTSLEKLFDIFYQLAEVCG